MAPPDNHLLTPNGGLPDAVARLFPTAGLEAPSGLVSAATGALALQQPSIGLGQGLVRKAGAAFGEQLGPSNPTLATDRIIHAIDGLRKAQDEDKTGTKGQVSSIKEGEKLDVFLARGCGQLSIELCKGVYGKELFHSIKRAELGLIKWPVLITNRVALSISGLWWGGTESFTLLAADCATARVEQIENWSPPTEHKLEARGKAPTTFLTWLRYAENSIKVFGSAYGLEHVQERNKFLQALREAHEEDENAFPFAYCVQLFEEMTAVWCEEIRESRRRLCAKLGTENPRLEDFKLVALSPSTTGQANFQFPRVWDLADPAGYYQKRVILPRQNKAMARLLNKQLHDHVLRRNGRITEKLRAQTLYLQTVRLWRQKIQIRPVALLGWPCDSIPTKPGMLLKLTPRESVLAPPRLRDPSSTLHSARKLRNQYAGTQPATLAAIGVPVPMRTSRCQSFPNWTTQLRCRCSGAGVCAADQE